MPCCSDDFWRKFGEIEKMSEEAVAEVRTRFGCTSWVCDELETYHSRRSYLEGLQFGEEPHCIRTPGGWFDAAACCVSVVKAIKVKARLLMCGKDNESIGNTCFYINVQNDEIDETIHNFNSEPNICMSIKNLEKILYKSTGTRENSQDEPG